MPIDSRLAPKKTDAPKMICTLALAMTLAACGGGGGGAADGTGLAAAAAIVPAQSSAPQAVIAAAAGSTRTPAPAASAPATPAPVVPWAPVITSTPGQPVPVVFNASRSARAGDIVSVQGENFSSAPLVWLETLGSTQAQALQVVNQVGTGWMAVQIPAEVKGALALRISNGANASARVPLNAAWPHHLDAMQIVPGGAFRLIGRNLLLPGSTPAVAVDGLPASVDLAKSDEHTLAVTAPAGLKANSATVITVDNGNGTGPATLDRPIRTVTGASGDPLGLGVGWAAAFTPLMGQVINAATDTRLKSRVFCNGVADDAPALAAALIFAQNNGGGVVTLPAGTCRLGKGVQIFSNTVLQGAGKDATVLQAESDAPVFGYDMDRVAIRNLTINHVAATAKMSLNIRNSTRLAIQRVRFNLGKAQALWAVYGCTDLAVVDSDFQQLGSLGPGGPMLIGNAGFVFTGNTVYFLNNLGTNFDGIHDAYLAGNTWTRDAIRQTDPVITHTVTFTFNHRVALVGNTFKNINGPVSTAKNDSETITSEGGGGLRTEGLGRVASASATTVTDPAGAVNPNAIQNGVLPENLGIAIVAGKGAGQTRRITAFAAGTFTVDRPWDVVPDNASAYATAVWTMDKVLIKGNSLNGSPHGIFLYSSAARDVDIVGNSMVENGGILVRGYQNVAAKWFTPVFNIRIENNTLSNSTRQAASTIAVHFANNDGQAFGTTMIGVEVRRNALTANSPNLNVTSYMGPSGYEGFMNQMNVESASYTPTAMARLLGTVMQANTCTNCATAFRLGTGAVGTVIFGNQLVNSGGLWMNSATSTSTDVAVGTLTY